MDGMIKSYSASLDKLYEMLMFIKEQAEAVGFAKDFVSKIELASEEALVNIISYGYPGRIGSIDIECEPIEKKGIKIVFRDKGVPYNPLGNRKQTDTKPSLQEKTIGGYGIHFILTIMDEVLYNREDNLNVLTLIKYLP